MKLIHPLVAWLALSAIALADNIKIEAPTEPVAVGQNVHFFLHGVTQPELQGIADMLVLPNEGVTAFGAYRWEGQPYIEFTATIPGVYHIVLIVPKLVDGRATSDNAQVSFVVGGPQPPFPPVPPIPDPPVPPPGQVSFLILYESSARTPSEILTLTKLRAYADQANLAIRLEDKDLIDGLTNKPPLWIVPYLTALNTSRVEVPAILVGSTVNGVFSVVAVEPLPKTGAEAIALVKQYGG